MNDIVEIRGKKYKLVPVVKGKTVRKTATKTNGLDYWTKRGFKVTKKGFKVKASNDKTYNAVKGVTKEGTELTLLNTHGGSLWKKAF